MIIESNQGPLGDRGIGALYWSLIGDNSGTPTEGKDSLSLSLSIGHSSAVRGGDFPASWLWMGSSLFGLLLPWFGHPFFAAHDGHGCVAQGMAFPNPPTMSPPPSLLVLMVVLPTYWFLAQSKCHGLRSVLG